MIEFIKRILDAEDKAEAAAKVVMISLNDLEGTLANHPSLYAYAATEYAIAESARVRAEVEVKRAKARAVKTLLNLGNSKTAADRLIEVDPGVVEAGETLQTHTERAAVLRAVVQALDHRKDMLVNLSARTRRTF